MARGPFDNGGGDSVIEFPDAGKDKFNELLYARKFLRKLKLRTKSDDWFVWSGKAWEPRHPAHYQPLAMAVLPEPHRKAKHAKSLMEHAAMIQQLGDDEQFAGAIRFDSGVYSTAKATKDTARAVLVNCANGVLRVTAEDVTLGKHDEDLLFTGSLAAEWPNKNFERAHAPLFTTLLDQVLPDSRDQALQQWFAAYLLYPSCEHEVFLISHGNGGTGKSTVSDAIMSVVGDGQLRSVLSMAQICAEGDGAYSLPFMQHALVNMGTELDTVHIRDSSNFKRFVSGEPVRVRPIYDKPFTMMGYCVKLWFNANTLPLFKHGSDAELRRSRFLEFVHPPAVKDEMLKARLAVERDAIFAWMVAGLQQILGGAKCPEGSDASRQVKMKFALSNDPVSTFAEECLVFAPTHKCKKNDLFNEFHSFLSSWGFGEKAKAAMMRQFYERYPAVTAMRIKPDENSPREHWLSGVALKRELQGMIDEETPEEQKAP